MTINDVAPIIFKYLALPNGLGGRGGAQRFFLLANNIPFEENLVDMSEWGDSEKERVIKSGENPCGSVPILYTTSDSNNNNSKSKSSTLIQHIASSRYLAHLYGITQKNSPYEEYVQDLVADEYQGFRNDWVHTAFSGSEEDKTKYKMESVPQYLTKFDALYAKYKTHPIYLSTTTTTTNSSTNNDDDGAEAEAGNPLWGDAAMFGLLRDNILTGLIDPVELETRYPNLLSMYQAFGKIPAVEEWINNIKKE